MAMSIEAQERLRAIRLKVQSRTHTIDDMREAVILIRQDRKAAAEVSTKSREKKVGKPKIDSDAMLAELEGL